MTSSITEYLTSKSTEAQRIYEQTVLEEAHGRKIKSPAQFVDVMGILKKTLKDFENDVQTEKEFMALSEVASLEQSARDAMHRAGEQRRVVLDEIREAEQLLKDKRRAAEANYDQKRREFERINDASCRLAKSNAIGARVLREKLESVLKEQRAIGEKLRQVRESLSRLRQSKTHLENELVRVPYDMQVQEDHDRVAKDIRSLSAKEFELVEESEKLQSKYEAIRLSRGIEDAETSSQVDEIDAL